MPKVKVKYVRDVEPIAKLDIGDWIDLRAAERVYINKGEHKLIPLGIAMELPKGYEAHIVPRSSTFKNFKILLTNSCGIIDNTYRGEWFFSALAFESTCINQNDRICQFRLFKIQKDIEIITVDELTETKRGSGGHGSTGIK